MTLLTYEKYNKTKFAVRGDMEKHHLFVKSLNGRVNTRMKGGKGWLVDIKYESELENFVREQREESDVEQEDDTPVFQSENVYEDRFDTESISGISTVTEESEEVELLSEGNDDESTNEESEDRETLGREKKEHLQMEKDEIDNEKKFEIRKRKEYEYELKSERERLESKRHQEENERRHDEQTKEYELKRQSDNIQESIKNETDIVSGHENMNSIELHEMLEYYRKFSKPIKPKTDKNYIAIAKIINKLNTRVTKLEHKYQRLKQKYSDLKSNRR